MPSVCSQRREHMHWRQNMHNLLGNVYRNNSVTSRLSWASYQIRKMWIAHAPGMPGTFSPHRRLQRKPLVSDPGMHHGTCVTHVPWCMSGSRTRGGGENVPGIPGACAHAILRILQEALGTTHLHNTKSVTLCNRTMIWHINWLSYDSIILEITNTFSQSNSK